MRKQGSTAQYLGSIQPNIPRRLLKNNLIRWTWFWVWGGKRRWWFGGKHWEGPLHAPVGSMLAWRQADPLSPRKGMAFVPHCQRAALPRPAHHRLPSAVCVPRGKMNIALGHTWKRDCALVFPETSLRASASLISTQLVSLVFMWNECPESEGRQHARCFCKLPVQAHDYLCYLTLSFLFIRIIVFFFLTEDNNATHVTCIACPPPWAEVLFSVSWHLVYLYRNAFICKLTIFL